MSLNMILQTTSQMNKLLSEITIKINSYDEKFKLIDRRLKLLEIEDDFSLHAMMITCNCAFDKHKNVLGVYSSRKLAEKAVLRAYIYMRKWLKYTIDNFIVEKLKFQKEQIVYELWKEGHLDGCDLLKIHIKFLKNEIEPEYYQYIREIPVDEDIFKKY